MIPTIKIDNLWSCYNRVVILLALPHNFNYRLQDRTPEPDSALFDFGDMQFDSDGEIASENDTETNSDCATSSEQSDKINWHYWTAHG